MAVTINAASMTQPEAFPRDEVVRAIERRGGCRMPQYFKPVALFFRNEALYDFFEKWPNDLVHANDGLEPRRFDLIQKDAMTLHGSSAVGHILDDWARAGEVCDLVLPRLTTGWVDAVKSRVEQTPGVYHYALHLGLLFEFAYLLRGMEQFFVDLYEHRGEVEALLDRVLDYTCRMMKGYGDAGIDGVVIGDDWGSQRSLLIDPDLWRGMFKPRYRAWVDACRKAGVHTLFHSDGNLDSIFPDLVETGIDAFHPLQPGAMDVDRWHGEYRDRICFCTGVDVQGMLPFASPREVRDSVRRSVEKFGSGAGGFILGPTNALTAEVPPENLIALYETLLEYR